MHYDKITDILDCIAAGMAYTRAAEHLGLTARTINSYLIRSRRGDPRFQEVEWYGVAAPFHVHACQNAKLLAAQAIEQAAYDRALNGCEVDVFFQGQRMYETVRNPKYADWSPVDDFGLPNEEPSDFWIKTPTKQWLKPSDALVLRMLEAHNKRFRPGQTMEVQHVGKLVLERPEEQKKLIDATDAVFEEVHDEASDDSARLALQRPAATSEEFDKWTAQGDFDPAPVKVVNEKGDERELKATPLRYDDTPNALKPQPGDRPDIAELKRKALELVNKGPSNPLPRGVHGERAMPKISGSHPDDNVPDDGTRAPPPYAKQSRKDALKNPLQTPGDGRERLGYGAPNPREGYSVTGGTPRGLYR